MGRVYVSCPLRDAGRNHRHACDRPALISGLYVTERCFQVKNGPWDVPIWQNEEINQKCPLWKAIGLPLMTSASGFGLFANRSRHRRPFHAFLNPVRSAANTGNALPQIYFYLGDHHPEKKAPAGCNSVALSNARPSTSRRFEPRPLFRINGPK